MSISDQQLRVCSVYICVCCEYVCNIQYVNIFLYFFFFFLQIINETFLYCVYIVWYVFDHMHMYMFNMFGGNKIFKYMVFLNLSVCDRMVVLR